MDGNYFSFTFVFLLLTTKFQKMKTNETSKAWNECKKCGSHGIKGKALNNSWISFDDFGGDAGNPGTTMSRQGPAQMVDCMKCSKCGHSWVPTDPEWVAKTQTWQDAEYMSPEQHPNYKQGDLVKFFNGTEGVVDKYTMPHLQLKGSSEKHHMLNIKEFIIVPEKDAKKQYTELNIDLFKKYINKFKTEDKYVALSILIDSLDPENDLKSREIIIQIFKNHLDSVTNILTHNKN